MKRALLAAVIGGTIALFSGAIAAQAAPIAVPKATEAGTSVVQKTGYYNRRHRHYRHRHWRRPVVRWHRHYHAPRRWVRPHYRHHRHWTHRHHRRHYH
jgi:hypothetical protein